MEGKTLTQSGEGAKEKVNSMTSPGGGVEQILVLTALFLRGRALMGAQRERQTLAFRGGFHLHHLVRFY